MGRSTRRWSQYGSAALAASTLLAVAACGSSSSGTTTPPSALPRPAPAAAPRQPAQPERHHLRRHRHRDRFGLDRTGERDLRLGQGLPGRLQGRRHQLRRRRLRQGRHRLHQPAPTTSPGSDFPLTADAEDLRRQGVLRRRSSRPADGSGRNRDRLQPAGRHQPEPLGLHDREHLQRQDQDLGRPGDQGRQPRRHAAEHHDPDLPPLGQLGHHVQLHELPDQRRQERLDLRRRQELDGSRRTGRQGLGRALPRA